MGEKPAHALLSYPLFPYPLPFQSPPSRSFRPVRNVSGRPG
jgi:hypothetical protein